MRKKIGSVLPKTLIKNRFVQTLMAYISLNIEVVTKRVTYSELAQNSESKNLKKNFGRQLTSKFQS